jgi:ferrochelatase
MPIPAMFQRPLARIIASRRSPKVAKRYQAIGGGSPLLKWTRLTAMDVMRELSKQYPQVDVFVGMRYAEPFIRDELNAAVDEGCRHLVVFPMYPQYCKATTGTAMDEVIDWLDNTEADISMSVIDHWHDRPEYIELLRRNIDRAVEQVEGETPPKVLFSAHAIPQKLVDRGDPYLDQIRETVALAGEGYDFVLAFQSRTGPVKWVGPDTIKTVRMLAHKGEKRLIIVPISFVSDHIETLYEIDIELKEIADRAGIETFIRTESFNDDERFAEILADMIEEKIAPTHS